LHSVAVASDEQTVPHNYGFNAEAPTIEVGSNVNAMIGPNGEWINNPGNKPSFATKNNGTPVWSESALRKYHNGLVNTGHIDDRRYMKRNAKNKTTHNRLSRMRKTVYARKGKLHNSQKRRKQSRKISHFCPRCFCFDTIRRLVREEPNYKLRRIRANGATWICENCGMNNVSKWKLRIKESTYKEPDEYTSCIGNENAVGMGVY
jgi:hypothetical protein